MQGILKTNTSVFRLEEGRRKGFKHPKSRGKKLFLWSLWENKKNELRCITIGRGQKEGFKHPESKDINCSFELHGVNSIFLVYRNNSTRSIGWVPKQTMWRTSWPFWDYVTECLRFFSIDQFIALILVQNSKCVHQKQNQNCISLVFYLELQRNRNWH